MNDKQFELLLAAILLAGQEDFTYDTIDSCFDTIKELIKRFDVRENLEKGDSIF